MDKSLETVLITGSSRGIGKAAALEFAKKDCNIIINCKKSKEKLTELKEFLIKEKKTKGKVEAYVCDVSDYSQVEEMFKKIEGEFGGIDVLINNAGISSFGLFNLSSPENWDYIIKNNLNSALNCSHLALPYMINKKNGVIINISSIWGNVGASCEVIYSASKGGLNAFTKALAKELGPSGIKVNAIACGVIDTEMNDNLSQEEKKALADEIPLCRFGKSQEVAALIYHIAENSYISGQIITIDGGMI